MSYKEIVLNYIKTHDVPYHLKEDIEDELQKMYIRQRGV
jgi:hypothetical protein